MSGSPSRPAQRTVGAARLGAAGDGLKVRRALFTALFLLPVLILLPHLGQVAFHPTSAYSDLLISHYSNARYLQQTIREWGSVPLWSPLILSGYPFAANPLSGLFYLPGWLALLFPLPLGLNLLMAAHLVFGGVGMYRFLRAEGLGEAGALLGGLSFAALPKLYAHLGAGHVTLLYAVPWTPWLLLADRSARGRTGWLLPGAVLALTALADVRWAAYAALLWGAYSLRELRVLRANAQRAGAPVVKAAWTWLGSRVSNALFALLGAAALLLPLAEYTRLSTRSLLTAADRLTLSLPPGQFLGLVFPAIGGPAEWILYPGAVTAALALFALGYAPLRRRARFWLALAGLTLLLALGDNLPLLDKLFGLPGFDLLRVPPRMLFLTGFCLAVTAGYALDALLAGVVSTPDRQLPARDRSGLLLFGTATFAVLLAAAVWFLVVEPLPHVQFTWGALVLTLAVGLVFLARSGKLSAGALTVLVVSLSLVDLIGVNGLSLVFRGEELMQGEAREVAEFLQSRQADVPFRVYSPSYSLPQHIAVEYGLELADGIDPLQYGPYAAEMVAASGVPAEGYSVTLPPFAEADPRTANAAYTPDLAKLGRLNVRYIVAAYELPGLGLEPLAQVGSTFIYENPHALPRAWVQPAHAPTGESILAAPVQERAPGRITVSEAGPGPALLVLAEVAYPGWQVTVNGRPARLEVVDGLLRGVALPRGVYTVEFVFRPLTVYAGLALSGLAWLALLILSLMRGTLHGRTS